MKITQYGKSYVVHRWRAWTRWWRHPERELARRQFRRGIRFWWHGLWKYILIFALLLKCAELASMFLDPRRFWFISDIAATIPLVGMIAWLICIQDEGMNFFRGRRLGEIMITPSGPRRYFPSLLMAPLATIVSCGAMITVFNVLAAIVFLYHPPPGGDATFSYFYKRINGATLEFGSWIFFFGGITAAIAAWTIGNGRSVAMVKSVLIFLGIYFLFAFLAFAIQLTAGRFSRTAEFIATNYVMPVCAIAFGILIWRDSLNRLRGPKAIEHLQKIMESAK